MNADELIDLVERHPLPWGVTGFYFGRVHYGVIGSGETFAHLTNADDGTALAQAAPAVIAAAIRLLRHPHAGRGMDGICTFCERDDGSGNAHTDDCLWPALRAALPASLRP